MPTVYTIGHSNHEFQYFLRLLRSARIDVLVDVRSNPNSAWVPFAKKDNLKDLISSSGIRYLYMGDTLGGQPSDPGCYDSQTGKIDYELLQKKDSFKQSIKRLIAGSKTYQICLMCAEESPSYCHRSLLLSNALSHEGLQVLHIRGDERIQTDEELSKERAGVPVNQQKLPI